MASGNLPLQYPPHLDLFDGPPAALDTMRGRSVAHGLILKSRLLFVMSLCGVGCIRNLRD